VRVLLGPWRWMQDRVVLVSAQDARSSTAARWALDPTVTGSALLVRRRLAARACA
jgi:hypothetical protein